MRSFKGESFFFTVAKNLERWINVPVAPYVGAAYGTFRDDLRPIAGGNIRLTEQLAALIIYDGKNTHSTLSWTKGRHVLTAMLVQVNDDRFTGGVAYSISFDLPKSGN